MVEIFVKKGFKVRGQKYEEGQTYDVDEELADKVTDKGYAMHQPEIEEIEDIEEEAEEAEIPEDLEKFLINRGFTKDPEKNVYSKEVKVGDRNVRLVRDFDKSEKGAKMAIDIDSDESLKDVAENHPDMKYFTSLRNEEIELEDAIIKAENKSKSELDIDESPIERAGQKEISAGQSQKLKVDMEPAIQLDEEETTDLIENNVVNGLELEDLDALVWDPEKENVPYDRPTASAEAYDLFSRIVEMAMGVTYNIENVEFRETDDTYECDVVIVRSSPTPGLDGKVMKGYKTRLRSAVGGLDHWRERLYTKAKRNALKQEIPKTWISRLLKRYKDLMR